MIINSGIFAGNNTTMPVQPGADVTVTDVLTLYDLFVLSTGIISYIREKAIW